MIDNKHINMICSNLGITLKAVYEYYSKNSSEIENIDSILYLKGNDKEKVLALLYLLSNDENDNAIQKFRSEAGLQKALYDSANKNIKQYNTMLVTALIYNPVFYAMAVNYYGAINSRFAIEGMEEKSSIKRDGFFRSRRKKILWGICAAAALLCVFIPVFLFLKGGEAIAETGTDASEPVWNGARRVAVSVGSELTNAVINAETMYRVHGGMGRVAGEDNYLLTNPSLSDIIELFDTLSEKRDAARENFQTVELDFYYSGYAGVEGFLLSRETFSYRDVQEQIKRIDPDMKMIIIDYCYTGAMTPEWTPASFFTNGSAGDYAVLSSGSDYLSFQESGIEGTLFTQTLVAGLRGAADTKGVGRVTLEELHIYAETEMEHYGRTFSFEMQISGARDMVLTEIDETSASLSFEEALTGRLTVRDSSGALVVDFIKADTKRIRLGLLPGQYTIAGQEGGPHGVNLQENHSVYVRKVNFYHAEEPFEIFNPPERESFVKVYAAGFSGSDPRFWKDGEGKGLIYGSNHYKAEVNAIAVHNGSIYLAGFYYFGQSDAGKRACYWADGRRIELPGGTMSAAAAITVAGGKVYVFGYYGGFNDWKACYWIDGGDTAHHIDTAHPVDTSYHIDTIDLPDGTSNSYYILNSAAGSIAVEDNKIYVTGFHKEGRLTIASYWANGIKRENHNFGIDSNISGFIVSGGREYAAGHFMDSSPSVEGGPSTKACYWVDGKRMDLHESNWNSSAAKAVSVEKGIVYVSGEYTDNNGKKKYCYWENGLRKNLGSDYPAQEIFSSGGMTVANGNVFIAGHYGPAPNKACYWVNGVKENLPGGPHSGGISTKAHFIAVE